MGSGPVGGSSLSLSRSFEADCLALLTISNIILFFFYLTIRPFLSVSFLLISTPDIYISVSRTKLSNLPWTASHFSLSCGRVWWCQDVWWLFNLSPAQCFIITPENLITVTLHATVPFMGCLFIKPTPLETINLRLQRAWPDQWDVMKAPVLLTQPDLPHWAPRPHSQSVSASVLPWHVLVALSHCLFDI